MTVIQLRQHLLHYGLTEKYSLGPYTEPVAILPDGSHLTIIQIDDLPVSAHKSLLLLLEIFRVYALCAVLLLFGHFFRQI